ncbi:AAA family ATPase, partial [Patescibacteria group bacterium]|nr:AAA family ATPase [Patescibacteria group bacterium]
MYLLNRTIIPKIIQQFDNNLILILIGARQAGKTHLLKLIEANIKSEHPDNKVLYLNLEDESLLLQIADYKNFLIFLKTQGVNGGHNKTFILLDEFQKLPRPTKLLKLIYDNHPNLKIIATGSSSLDIYKKMREESMAGRKRIFNVFPLSFNEFLSWQYPDLSKIFARIIEKNLDPSSISQNFVLPFNEFTV